MLAENSLPSCDVVMLEAEWARTVIWQPEEKMLGTTVVVSGPTVVFMGELWMVDIRSEKEASRGKIT